MRLAGAPAATPIQDALRSWALLPGLELGGVSGLEGAAAAALRQEGLGFWASAALLFLSAPDGNSARVLARWLLELRSLDESAAYCRRVEEFCYCLQSLLESPPAPSWSDSSGVRALAADFRSVFAPALHAALPPRPRGVLTREQSAVVEIQLPAGGVAKALAFAGAGKTTTLLRYAARHPEWRILYTAFNKSIAVQTGIELSRLGLGRHMVSKTTHSLAMSVGCGILQRRHGQAKPFYPSGLKWWAIAKRGDIPGCSPMVGEIAVKASDWFLTCDDHVLTMEHVTAALRSAGGDGGSILADPKQRALVLTIANIITNRQMSPDDTFPFSANAYLRAFVRSHPLLPYDCILVDEAQDLNPITLRLFTDARARGVRIVYAGDEHQHIYSFNGSKNFLSLVRPPNSGLSADSASWPGCRLCGG